MARGLNWGGIHLINFGGRQKSRPALIITREGIIEVLSAVTVIPITRTIREIPTELKLGVANGLKEPCVATCDNLQTIRKEIVGQWVGTLEPSRAPELRAALLFAFGLERQS